MKHSLKIILVAMLLVATNLSTYAQAKYPVITPANAGALTEIARLGQGHARFMALSPDGTRVALASDARLQVLDSTTFTTLLTLDLKTVPSALAYSPDGKYIAVGDYVGLTQVIEFSTGKVIASFQSDNQIQSVAFHPSRPEVITGEYDGGHVWDIASGNKITDLNNSQDSIVSILFTTEGKLITAASNEKITYWDDSYHQINEIRPNDRVVSLALDPINPNRFALATGSFSDIITIDGSDVHEQQFKVEHSNPNALSYSHDGKWVAEGWENGHIYVRDAETGAQLHDLDRATSVILSLQVSPKDDQIWALSYNDNLYVWDAATGKLVTKFGVAAGEMTAVAFSPDGKTIAAAGKDDGYIHLWDSATFAEEKPLDDGRTDHSIAYSLDGKYLATGGEGDYHVHVWNIVARTAALDLAGATYIVNSVAFSPDGKMVASGSSDGSARIWDTQTGKLIYGIDGGSDPQAQVMSVIFTTDSSTLLTSTFDDEVHFYTAKDGKKGDEFKAKVNLVETLSINADTTNLAVGGFDEGLTYSLNTTQKIKPIPATVSLSGRKMVFDPAGDMFAAALDHLTKDPTLVLIDLKDKPGQQLLALDESTPDAVVFNPDGTLLASALRNGYVVIYGVKS